ncbi:MAG: NAD(+)/NADH kinase [Chloroflexi bacterium]|nr:NAD(+)/NADH kinase [Chloroflexota bacterium]
MVKSGINTIGILFYPLRPDSAELADEVSTMFDERGVSVWRGDVRDEQALRAVAPDLDMLLTLGGDGTIVRATRNVSAFGVPLLGVNLGTLGFLAEVEPTDVEAAVTAVLDGKYTIEDRMMLHMELRRDGKTVLETEAVNDVFLGRGITSRKVHVSVEVDGYHVMTQVADGVIVSTPTGSTAYCLAAGGPIIAPDLDCITLTPVAPHLSLAHAVVIPPTRTLCLRLIRGEGAIVTVDGQVDSLLDPGDQVRHSASEFSARFVRFGGDGSFYETVLRRLRWPDQRPKE